MSPTLLPLETPKTFILAGRAVFTAVSRKTGTRYTFRVSASDTDGLWFVGYLSGPDNQADYSYLGLIRDGQFSLTRKSFCGTDSQVYKAFKWVWDHINEPTIPGVDIFHAGRCGRCARVLTVPASIVSGFGPECIGKL